MGVYVPGEYFNAEDNGDGTYTCSLNTEGNVEGYTAETAPVVMPVNTPGYAAMNPPESYDSKWDTERYVLVPDHQSGFCGYGI